MRCEFCFRCLLLSAVLLLPLFATAQTTEFTFQGKLTDGAMPPTANYDFEFRLFGAETGGAALATQQRSGVSVANGIFTVRLDFGAQFDGSARWLEIAVRPAGGIAFTNLAPRQPITSAPYAIRGSTAANSLLLGGIAPSGFIQNTTVAQTANFNVSGNGTIGGDLNIGGAFNANILNANTQYNLGGNRILSATGNQNFFGGLNAGTSNTTGFSNAFVGAGAGALNTSGFANSFFGSGAGAANVNGVNNSFFGQAAGFQNTTGQDNTFVGNGAGLNNTIASQNTFVGSLSGQSNTTGSFNAFFGNQAGNANSTGSNNSFFGAGAGVSNTAGGNSFFGRNAGNANTTGDRNAFFGAGAGNTNATGNSNTLIGAGADIGGGNLSFAVAIGADAVVSQTDAVVLGRLTANVGIGLSAPQQRLHIRDNSGNILFGNGGCNPGFAAIGFSTTLTCTNYSLLGDGSNTIINRPTGGIIAFREGNTDQMTINASGIVSINTLAAAGNTPLCRNASFNLAVCSSSLRYKENVQTYAGGLEIVRRLRPVTFNWKNGGTADVGFTAEEVEKTEPLLATRNEQGEIEGVKYAQITTVLVNSVNQQQTEIEAFQKQIAEQQKQIEALKKLVCAANPTAEICREER